MALDNETIGLFQETLVDLQHKVEEQIQQNPTGSGELKDLKKSIVNVSKQLKNEEHQQLILDMIKIVTFMSVLAQMSDDDDFDEEDEDEEIDWEDTELE